LVAVAACAPNYPQMAHDTFASAYQCNGAARPRPEMGSAGYEQIFEVAGCGHDVIYQCDGGLADAAGNMTVPPSCRATAWCTQPGCTNDDPKAAGAKFATDHSCPLERVTAQRTQNPAQPPPEIAADPARLAMWNQQQAQLPRTHYVAVQGCNTASTYMCVHGTGEAPACVEWSDPSATGSASAPSVTPQ
jgi:hypothetical protein